MQQWAAQIVEMIIIMSSTGLIELVDWYQLENLRDRNTCRQQWVRNRRLIWDRRVKEKGLMQPKFINQIKFRQNLLWPFKRTQTFLIILREWSLDPSLLSQTFFNNLTI